MKNIFLIALFSILLISCKKQTENKVETKKSDIHEKYQNLVDNQTVYGLINCEALNENKIFKSCENVLNRETTFCSNCDSLLLEKIDTLFSKKDKEFIVKQYKNSIHFILDQKLLKHKNIIEYDTTMLATREKSRAYWDKLLEKYHCIETISLPLFNLKKDMAIVQISYNCGILCGEGGTYIFKLNRSGEWELYLKFEEWIS